MINFFRILFILISMLFAVLYYIDFSLKAILIAAVLSVIVALAIVIVVEYVSHTFSSRVLLAAIAGLTLGLMLSHLIVIAISAFPAFIPAGKSAVSKGIIYHVIGFSIMMFFIINNEEIAFLDRFVSTKIEESKSAAAS